jgi:signal peptidase I
MNVALLLSRVSNTAWIVLALMLCFSLVSVAARGAQLVPSNVFLFIIQPLGALLIAAIAWYSIRGASDRAKRRSEKAYMVGSVIAVWFVVYFLSGLGFTYMQNTLFTSAAGVVLNVVGYGVAAISLEYTRYALMRMAGRRNIIWFGAIIVLVFSLQQLNLTGFSAGYTAEQLLKFLVSDVVPILTTNLLLTYLAVSAGLPAMLTYRLGTLAVMLLLPILPKFDWYMIGMSTVLLTLAVYLVIDRAQQGRHAEHRRHHQHVQKASNTIFIIIFTALVFFVTGIFEYKPVVIVSNSMQPVYGRGSVVVVRKGVEPIDIQVGDIIQYRHKQNSEMITHRVVEIQQTADTSGERVFITKGDNNQSLDAPVLPSQLNGIVKAQIPLIGYPTIWLRMLLG